jgi:hypothetical protein
MDMCELVNRLAVKRNRLEDGPGQREIKMLRGSKHKTLIKPLAEMIEQVYCLQWC